MIYQLENGQRVRVVKKDLTQSSYLSISTKLEITEAMNAHIC